MSLIATITTISSETMIGVSRWKDSNRISNVIMIDVSKWKDSSKTSNVIMIDVNRWKDNSKISSVIMKGSSNSKINQGSLKDARIISRVKWRVVEEIIIVNNAVAVMIMEEAT